MYELDFNMLRRKMEVYCENLAWKSIMRNESGSGGERKIH